MKSLTNKQITIINKYIEYIKVLYMNRGNGYSINVIIKDDGINYCVYYGCDKYIQICGHPLLLYARYNTDEVKFSLSESGKIFVDASEDEETIKNHVKLSLNESKY